MSTNHVDVALSILIDLEYKTVMLDDKPTDGHLHCAH